jgi:hypothetical protein
MPMCEAPWTAAARRRLNLNRSASFQGGVEPPQSKVLRTAIFVTGSTLIDRARPSEYDQFNLGVLHGTTRS